VVIVHPDYRYTLELVSSGCSVELILLSNQTLEWREVKTDALARRRIRPSFHRYDLRAGVTRSPMNASACDLVSAGNGGSSGDVACDPIVTQALRNMKSTVGVRQSVFDSRYSTVGIRQSICR
jgi:hypothetical protein